MVFLPSLLLQPLPTLYPALPLLHQHPQSLRSAPNKRPHPKTRPRDPRAAPRDHLPLPQNPQHAAQHSHVLAAARIQNPVLGQSGDRGLVDVDARAGRHPARLGVLGPGVDGGVQVLRRQSGAEDGKGHAAALWECGGVEVERRWGRVGWGRPCAALDLLYGFASVATGGGISLVWQGRDIPRSCGRTLSIHMADSEPVEAERPPSNPAHEPYIIHQRSRNRTFVTRKAARDLN